MREAQGPGGGVPLATSVRDRADEQLRIAKAGEVLSEASAKGILVAQQRLAAEMAFEAGDQEYQKAAEAVPRGKAAAAEATHWFEEAQRHAEHTKELLVEARKLPEDAARKAAQAIEEQVRREAYAAAERAGATTEESPEERAKQVAARVAAAVEPYHLGQLRAQKETAISYTKAKNAAAASTKLVEQAQVLAATAQAEQASGLTLKANWTMEMAHDTMEKAVNLRARAKRLYAEAEEINSSVGGYQRKQQQAAAAAAAAMEGSEVSSPALPPLPGAL